MTRQLNRANFTKYIPVGSTSTYCQQFKHYKTGKLIHVLWTICGERPVTVKTDKELELYDPNDNVTKLTPKDGAVTFTINQSPCYLQGLSADAEITLGESDHSDSKPGENIVKLGNMGDGTWKLVVEEEDKDYTKNKPFQIERFLGDMVAENAEAPADKGGKALAVHLKEKQEIDRGVMPYYTTIKPNTPVTIPGKGSHLGLWVHAASDWGRVVYVLRDAKDVKWISVGTKEQWNNDDIHGYSHFSFDGWRYLKFPLPSSAPFDSYRENGTTWWGAANGDAMVVELPLKIEKIFIERRPKVVYGNDLVAAKPDDVLLADMIVEYASAEDKTDEAIRLSKLRLPPPPANTKLANPIIEMNASGIGKPTKILAVEPPNAQSDGTQANVSFEPVEGAKKYHLWVSAYKEGSGALRLSGAGWPPEPTTGKRIWGLRPAMPFYAFIVYEDKDGKMSKPSEAFPFELKDTFGFK